MGKKATTIDRQIELLENRGMTIKEKQKAKEYLLDIGYYRLGLYWYHFENDHHRHTFKANTQLRDIIKLYYLDVDLRNILSHYLYRIEVNFRTQVVYHISNHYLDSPTWFNDPKIVGPQFLKILPNIYDDYFKKYNAPIKKHHEKYINDLYAPAWKTLEFFTFGQIFRLYKNLTNESLKKKIANLYGIKNLSVFKNHMQALINIRNICSHSNVLFDYNQPKGIRKTPHKDYVVKGRNQTSLNASLHLILFMLSKVSQNRANDLKIKLEDVFTTVSKNQILQEIVTDQIRLNLFD